MKKLFARRTFVRYCLSYLLVLVVPVTVIAASFNMRFIADYRQTLITQMQLTAEKTMSDLERELSQMNMIALQFSYDGEYSATRLREEPLLYRDIREQLVNYVNISTFLSDIVYVNCDYPQRYYTSYGTYNAPYFYQYLLNGRSVSAQEYLSTLKGRHWIASAELEHGLANRQLQYACPLAGEASGWVLFCLPAGLIERILDLSASQVHVRAVLNETGHVLLGDTDTQAAWHDMLLSCDEREERLFKLQTGEYVLITSSSSLGLTCIYTIAERTLLEQVDRLSQQFLYLLIIMLMAGCAVAVYLSRSMTRPIDALVSTARQVTGREARDAGGEISVVRDALESVHRENVQLHSQYLRMERQNVLMRLMSGQYSCREELEGDCAGVQIPAADSAYTVVLIDELSVSTGEMEREIGLLFESGMLVYGFRFREQQCQVFLLIEEGKQRVGREILFERLIRRYPGVMLVLGGEEENLWRVQQSYQDAVFSRRIAQIKGLCAPIMSGTDHIHDGGQMYPKQEIDALYKILEQGDVEKLGVIQDTLLYTLRTLGSDPVFQQALCYDIISTYNLALAKLGVGGRSDRQPFKPSQRNSLHLDRLLEIIQGLYNEAVDAFIAKETPVLSDEMDQILAYIDEKREGVLGVCEVAEHFGISTSNLSHQFKRATGETLSNYIAARKLCLAKELLCDTDLDVSVIGERLGYNHPSSFIRMFRKAEGVTPLQYRDEHRA